MGQRGPKRYRERKRQELDGGCERDAGKGYAVFWDLRTPSAYPAGEFVVSRDRRTIRSDVLDAMGNHLLQGIMKAPPVWTTLGD